MAKEIAYYIDENGCHVCSSHAKTKGYARIKKYGRPYLLHRFIYEEVNGRLPDGIVVRHKCDNPSCINVEHLETGTQADNIADMMARGRHFTGENDGENNGNSKITEAEVRKIRSDKESTNKSLAEKYGVHHATISAIRLGKTWSHIV